MIRKLIAAGVAAGLGALVLPALPAAASANSTARITSTADPIFPGGQTYTFSVTNTESGILGQGTTINALRIELPTSAAGLTNDTSKPATCGSAVGRAVTVGGTHMVDFRSGLAVAPGASVTCSVPTLVANPTSTDRFGTFAIKVSSDGFETNRNASVATGGTLSTAVRVLQVLTGTVRPTAPTTTDSAGRVRGVTDRSGTSGQVVTYSFDVKNHAKTALSVTPSLVTSSAAETPGTVGATPVDPGATVQMDVPLTLGAAPSGSQRSISVTARATAPSATAPTVNDPFTVQGPVTLSAANLKPTRTKSGALSMRDFTLDLTKTGVQTATLQDSTLSFGSNSASAATPVEYAGATQTKNLTYKFASITAGGDGPLAAELSNGGIDDNGAPLGTGVLDLGSIVIDNFAPVVTVNVELGTDRDGDERSAATNGHSLAITGTITGQGTGAAGSNDLDLSKLKVAVEPNAGSSQPVNVTTTKNADGSVSYSGTIAATTWDQNTTNFIASAEILDEATNRGFATTQPFKVDLNRPALHSPGEVLTNKLIGIKFGERIGTAPNIVQRDETSGVRGGCDPSAYLIDGVPGRVKNVTDSTGKVLANGNCDPKTSTADGVRYLVMSDNYTIDAVATPSVTYDVLERALGFRPAKDGTGTDALRAVIDTVNIIKPLVPTLVNVQRKNLNGSGNEAAFYDTDEQVYFTNATGAEDNTITVGGVRNGYVLQVRDASERVLNQVGPFSVPNNALGQPQSAQGSITVPLGDFTTGADGKPVLVSQTDKTYERRLVFVSSRSVPGDPLTLNIGLDTAAPQLGATAWDAATTTATQKFQEKIVAGSNASDNWYAAYTAAGDTGPETAYTTANSATTVDVFTRSIKFTLDNPNSFLGVHYVNFTGNRYEDRAGNLILDTLLP